jgi:hypothetical protein
MVLHEPYVDVDPAVAGPCSDCGQYVERRAEAIDGFTHSTVQLCAACWIANRQRHVFVGGCCG